MSYYDGSRGGGAARPHGTNARYQSGCRCDLCRRAKADYISRWRNRGTASDNDVPPVVRCPTCGHPAYDRPEGLQYAATQHDSTCRCAVCIADAEFSNRRRAAQ